jgi:hypothetical protein
MPTVVWSAGGMLFVAFVLSWLVLVRAYAVWRPGPVVARLVALSAWGRARSELAEDPQPGGELDRVHR